MPSYFPDPYEYIKAAREEKARGNTDLMTDGLNVNFRKKPWDPRARPELEEPEFEPLTPGDEEFNVRDYLIDAQVPSAHAETLQQDAKEQAIAALERYGPLLDPETRKQFEAIAAEGEPTGGNPFLTALNILDTPGELVRLGLADLLTDEKHDVEITAQDYLDSLRGREEDIIERLGPDVLGEDQFLGSGARLLEDLGYPEQVGFNLSRAALGFASDVILDPLNYISFGTAGFGKKVAIEGASAAITRGGREGLEAIAKDSVGKLTDSLSKEYAGRVVGRIESRLDDLALAPVERQGARDRITRTVLAEERRALDAAEGVRSLRNSFIDDVASDVPYVPTGTAVEDMASSVFKDLADKNFRSLADTAPWYTGSRHVPNFAKGGVQIGAPFGRKRFSLLRIPGTETNRLASRLLGRKVAASGFSKLPEGAQKMFRWLGQRTGVEKTAFTQAREGNLWRHQATANVVDLLEKETFTAEALRPLAHGIGSVYDTAAKHGIDKAEAGRLLRAQLGGDVAALDDVPDAVKYAVREAVDGDVEKGVDGIRQVFETFHDAARRVGMDIGHEPNYVPLVVTGKFGKLLDTLADEGVEIPLGKGSSDLSNIGMAILGRYVANTGEGAIGVAGANLTYSGFAQANNVTRLYRGAVGSSDLANDPNLFALLRSAGNERMSADLANDAISAALEDLGTLTGMSRSKLKSVDEAFHTDLETIFTAYTASMGEAVQTAALLRELKRYDLIRVGSKKLAISNTLSSVTGRLTDDTAEFVERIARGEAGAERASRLVNVKAGGRTFKVPATVASHPAFPKTVKQLERVFSRADRRGPEIRSAILAAEQKLIGEGYPAEIASKLALAEGDNEVAQAMASFTEMALEEAQVLETAAVEMGARGIVDADEVVKVATDEGRKILNGAAATIKEIEDQVHRAVSIPVVEGPGEAIDVLAQEINGLPMLVQMVEWFKQSVERRAGSFADFVASQPQRPLSGVSPGRIAQEAALDLSDRLTVANVTVGQVAEFGNPAIVARVLYEMNQRMLASGYRGVESLSDEIVEAVEEVLAAEVRNISDIEAVRTARTGGMVTETEATRLRALVRASQDSEKAINDGWVRLKEVAQPLRQSDEMMGPLVEHTAETVETAADNILQSPFWRDVWAVSIQKTGTLPRKAFNEELAELGEEGLTSLSQKEIVSRNLKTPMRKAADDARDLWRWAIGSEDEIAERRAAQAIDSGGGRMTRALRAMAMGDTDALVAFDEEFRHIIGSITDKNGMLVFDPARFIWREDGRLVMEPVETSFIGLPDVMDDIRSIVDQPNITDFEALRIAKLTFDDNPEVIKAASPDLHQFFRQVDAGGGLPQEIEDYEYLTRFVGDLKAQLPEATKAAPKAAKTAPKTTLEKVLDEAAAVLRREKGHGPRARKLDKLWEESRQALEKEMPVEGYERLTNLVSRAVASREVAPSRFIDQLRGMVGSTAEAQDSFVRDIAAMRMQGQEMGGPWIESVIDDTMAFRAAFERLQRFAPLDETGALRVGAEDLVDVGGELSGALDTYRAAGHKVVNDLRRIEKKPQLASFLPVLPEGHDDLPRFIEQLADEMYGWRPTIVDVPSRGYVNAKIPGLIGEAVDGLEMTPGTALMLEHMAAGAVAVGSPIGVRLAADSIREIEQWWKAAATVARPTFVPRNVMGGVLNGLMIGVGPRHYAAVRDNVFQFRRVFDDTGSYEAAIEAVSKNFRPYMEGLWRSGLLSSTFASTLNRLRPAATLAQSVNPLSSRNVAFRFGGKLMETSEEFLRAAAFVRWYDPNNPATARLAKEISLVAHFDYAALTSLETKIKRFVPFFVWTRRNLPLQMRMMVEQPGAVTRLVHAQQNVNDTWGDDNFVDEIGFSRSPYLSAFAMETPIIFEEDTPYWQRVIIDPQVPTADLEEASKAFSNGLGGVVDYLFRMVSPVYSAPFELAPNEDLVAAPTGLKEIMLWTDWLRPGEDQMSGEQVLVGPNWAKFFSTAFPFFAEWTRTAGLVPAGSGNVTARAGYNIEDGITPEERIKAAALSLARAGGVQLQTPGDTRAAWGRAIFEEINPAIDELHMTGKVIEPDAIEEYVRTLLAREGIDMDRLAIPVPDTD